MKAVTTIQSDVYGHHEAIVTSAPQGAGSTRLFRVHWANQSVTCCGRDLVIADGQEVPAFDSEPHGLAAAVTQCGTCGSLYAATVTVRRVSPEALA